MGYIILMLPKLILQAVFPILCKADLVLDTCNYNYILYMTLFIAKMFYFILRQVIE